MNLPNYITLLRILLVPVFFTVLISFKNGEDPFRWIALGIFLFATLTDALDGFLARITKRQTPLGRFLDPFADKLLILSGFLGILGLDALPYRPPLWVTVTIVFRDLMIVVGMLTIFLVSGDLRVQPNLVGKLTTAAQMLTLIAILMASPIAVPFWYATAALTILSFLLYLIREMRRLAVTNG